MIRTFSVKYTTPDYVPAPYSHQYKLEANIIGNKLQLEYAIVYSDRDTIDLEEIENEGFTTNDDFSEKAEVGEVWQQALLDLIGKTNVAEKVKDSPENEFDAPQLSWEQLDGQIVKVTPHKNAADWQYFVQELIQATLEAANREKPLAIRFRKVNKDKSFSQAELLVQFAERKVTVTSFKHESAPSLHQFSWEELRKFLQQLYAPEYYPEKALEDEPTLVGSYIDSGEGFWYKIGDGVRNLRGQQVLHSIEKQFGQWLD